MMKDTFFSMPRFVNLCRKDMVENWRTNMLRMLLLYGVMAGGMLWMGTLEYRHKTTLENDENVWQFMLVFFMYCLWGFGCMSASFTMEKMKSKTSRLSALMTPATSFEKYFSSWVFSTVVFLVVFLLAFWLADYTRVLVYSLIYPDLKGIAPLPFSHFVGYNTEYYTLFRTANEFTAVITLYFFSQSCFVLGSSICPKNAFLKTFVSLAIIAAVYAFILYWTMEMLRGELASEPMTREEVFTLISIACSVFTLFNWTLAYFRFKESEIINRM